MLDDYRAKRQVPELSRDVREIHGKKSEDEIRRVEVCCRRAWEIVLFRIVLSLKEVELPDLFLGVYSFPPIYTLRDVKLPEGICSICRRRFQ